MKRDNDNQIVPGKQKRYTRQEMETNKINITNKQIRIMSKMHM